MRPAFAIVKPQINNSRNDQLLSQEAFATRPVFSTGKRDQEIHSWELNQYHVFRYPKDGVPAKNPATQKKMYGHLLVKDPSEQPPQKPFFPS